MKKDKITEEIFQALKVIEYEEVTFEKRKKRLLEKYVEIYNSNNRSYEDEDLIARKIYLEKSLENFKSAFIGLVLGGLTSYILKIIEFQGVNLIETTGRTILNCFIISFHIIVFFVMAKIISDQMTQSDRSFSRYNTNEFEIELIDAILKEKYRLNEVKETILNTYSNNNTSIELQDCDQTREENSTNESQSAENDNNIVSEVQQNGESEDSNDETEVQDAGVPNAGS